MKKLIFALSLFAVLTGCSDDQIPYWLEDYKEIYKENPREASKAWFREAKFGMFVHLNLASLCENGKADYMQWESGKAPDRLLKFVGYTREEYDQVRDKNELLFLKYKLENFSAEKICELAVKAEMKYITLTTKHLGGCYNFSTGESEFNVLNSPAGRDLAKELAAACKKHGLALFFYLPPEYAQTIDEGQINHNRAIISELLTQYGPVAGIWFDGIGSFYQYPENYTKTKETFALVRELQPHAMVSFKEGGLCDEDFISPEHFMLPFEWKFDDPGHQERWEIRKKRWGTSNTERWETCGKHMLREVNTVMQECLGRDAKHVASGWINDESARHLTAEEVYYWLGYSRFTGSNMLMNIGPRGDGSIHPDDWEALTGVGEMIRTRGWPALQNQVE